MSKLGWCAKMNTWTRKMCNIIAIWAIVGAFGQHAVGVQVGSCNTQHMQVREVS